MGKLLIAGCGFLGRALADRFTSVGWQADKLSRSGNDGGLICDLSVADQVTDLTGDYDLVVHCAASGGGGAGAYKKVYVDGSKHLLARFPDARMIFTSSTSVYAQTDHSLVDETSMAEPVAETGKMLVEAEQQVLEAGGVVARLAGLYGPGRCHVLKNFLNGTARLDGDGERIMNFIHRDDVVEALWVLATGDVDAGVYNVTSEPVSQYDCYAQLASHFQKPMPESIDPNLPRKRGNSSKRVSNKKMKSTGWTPRYADFLSMALACQ